MLEQIGSPPAWFAGGELVTKAGQRNIGLTAGPARRAGGIRITRRQGADHGEPGSARIYGGCRHAHGAPRC